MDGTTSEDLLVKLINLRSKAIESIIKDESPHSVRHRIKLSVKILTDTVTLIHCCFISKYLLNLEKNYELIRNLKINLMLFEKFQD